jgi:hypothetical protein
MADWNRSHDWVLQRFWNDLTRVTIRFRCERPSVVELVALRRCLPEFQNVSPRALREEIGKSGVLSLGVLPTRQARNMIGAMQGQGLEVVAENASFASYLPLDRTCGCALLIEDDKEAESVAREMLALGIPIEDVQA